MLEDSNQQPPSWKFCLIVFLLSTGLAQVSAFSQAASANARASLRGTAKLNGRLVVEGVIVAVRPARKAARAGGTGDRATGTPLPARVSNTGEYRIEELSPGQYDLVAVGSAVKGVVENIVVQPGNSNIVDVVLTRAEKRTRVRGRVTDSHGSAITNTRVALYSAELPPSICEPCMIAEVTSNDAGEVDYADIAAEQSYSLAMRRPGASDAKAEMIVSAPITLGAEWGVQVEMRVGDGPQPVLTAVVLRTLQPPQMKSSEIELATVPHKVVPSGQKVTIKGVVTRRDSDTFVVRDPNGQDTVVRLDPETNVRAEGAGFLSRHSNYDQTLLLRGLILKVEGRSNDSGEIVASEVRFRESDLKIARAVESRVAPLEERASTTETKLTQVEQNAQRLSGQLDELAAVSNTLKGGTKAAQQTADAAVAGVNATNDRISALDDYEPQLMFAVNFRVGSADLSRDSKAKLDEVAKRALSSKGYVLEVSGFADVSEGRKRTLSQRRADAVIRYLVENHGIPLRRIVTPYGFGESNPVADNTTSAGRAQNRRVEIKLLVNRGLTQPK